MMRKDVLASDQIVDDCDPEPLPWGDLQLPDTWADDINMARPAGCLQLIRHLCSNNRGVILPSDMPGRDLIPSYVQQEFHNLPNGNYSKRFTRGYITGFDHVMLGSMRSGRQLIARQLRDCRSALDVGCAGGRTSRQVKDVGVVDVWGLDPSPYLLQHAARDNPDIHYVQGVAESTGFSRQRFDGIAVCFLLHELPPRYLQRALIEFNRILVPGGLVAICEPSPLQLQETYRALFRRAGWRGVYFGLLARRVHEPFVAAWHQSVAGNLFAQSGFALVEDESGIPLRHILLRKAGNMIG